LGSHGINQCLLYTLDMVIELKDDVYIHNFAFTSSINLFLSEMTFLISGTMVSTSTYHDRCMGVHPTLFPSNASLQNAVHLLFTLDRWLTGHEQHTHTHTFYYHIVSALRLISLFLGKDCVPEHFAHFKFGRRKRNETGNVYVARQTTPDSAKAKEDVRMDFCGLAKMITYTFCPRSYDEVDFTEGSTAYGRTFLSKEMVPFHRLHRVCAFLGTKGKGTYILCRRGTSTLSSFGNEVKYHPKDWPKTNPKQREHPKPAILFNAGYTDYLNALDYNDTSLSRWYRNMFLLVCTTVHEVAYAYNFYLSEVNEVHWSKYDVKPEFGFV
jgi:hypothetical protein